MVIANTSEPGVVAVDAERTTMSIFLDLVFINRSYGVVDLEAVFF